MQNIIKLALNKGSITPISPSPTKKNQFDGTLHNGKTKITLVFLEDYNKGLLLSEVIELK